jgi:hypothetical protein
MSTDEDLEQGGDLRRKTFRLRSEQGMGQVTARKVVSITGTS